REGTAAEGATGPRKRSGTRDRAGRKNLWKAGRAPARPHRRSKGGNARISQVPRQRGVVDAGVTPARDCRVGSGTKAMTEENLTPTPLDALPRERGARMAPFAGYSMPVQYPAGVLTEHLHCRAKAALFDVSHMGQGSLFGAGAAAALERLVPG